MRRALVTLATGVAVCVTAATFLAWSDLGERAAVQGLRDAVGGDDAESPRPSRAPRRVSAGALPIRPSSHGAEASTALVAIRADDGSAPHPTRGDEPHTPPERRTSQARRENGIEVRTDGSDPARAVGSRGVASRVLASAVSRGEDLPPSLAPRRTVAESIDPCDTPVAVLDGLGQIAEPVYSGDMSRRVVALTFDDGPSAENTPSILHTLRHKDAPATFFVLGERVAKMPELTAAIAEDGHELANHTWSHGSLASMFKSQLQTEVCRTAAAIEAASGQRPTRFRPPFGRFPDSSLPVLGGLGQQVVLWSVDGHDWSHDDPEALARSVVRSAYSGAIVLLHDREPLTARALPSIIGGLRARGFEIVPLASLLNADD